MNAKINSSNNFKNPDKRRVLFVITQSEFGGAQCFLHHLLSRLNPEQYQIMIAIGQTGDKEFLRTLEKEGRTVFFLRHLRREIGWREDVRAVFELRRLVKSVQPDVLFLNSSKAGFVGSLAVSFPQKISGLKVIYRIGGWTFNDPWSWWKKRLWIILEKMSAHWKDVIIVNNRHDFEQAKKLGIRPRQKLALVYNGLDPYKMSFLPGQEARLKLFEKITRYTGRIFQVKTIVGTIANFYPAKGLGYLIEAAGQFRNLEDLAFVIIGDGPERKCLKELAAQKRLAQKVFFAGKIPEASELITAFDIFVLPSVKEGFPWSVLEAMAAKVPVVATAVGAVPEVIQDGKNGLLAKPGNADELAQKIALLLENERLRQELGIQGHQTLLFKFGLDKMVRQITNLIDG